VNRKSSDIDIAKKDVKEKRFALSIVKDGETLFQSRMPGITALVQAIDEDQLRFRGASAADRILGKAAAMLFVYSEISSIFASIASQDALTTLKRFQVPLEYEKIVTKILNRTQTSTCPFERLVIDVDTPEEAFRRLKCAKLEVKTGKASSWPHDCRTISRILMR